MLACCSRVSRSCCGHTRALGSIRAPLTIRAGDTHGRAQEPAFTRTILTDTRFGDSATTSRVCFHSHHGTHVDALKHFVPDGHERAQESRAPGDDVAALPLRILNGAAFIVDFDDSVTGPITAEMLEGRLPKGVERCVLAPVCCILSALCIFRVQAMVPLLTLTCAASARYAFGVCCSVLLRTRHSRARDMYKPKFDYDFTALDASGARFMVEHGVKLVGVDYLSVATFADGVEAHRTMLGAGIVALEGLDLLNAPVDKGEVVLLALPLPMTDGDGTPVRVVLAY